MLFGNKIKYAYVPPCPRCGSKKTGRFLFVSMASFEVDKIITNKMRNGELVKTIGGFPDSSLPNIYCSDCGAEWHGDVETIHITKEQLEVEKKNRGISDSAINDMKNYRKNTKKKFKQLKKEKRKEKLRFKNKDNIKPSVLQKIGLTKPKKVSRKNQFKL